MSEAERYYSRLSQVYDWLAASEKKFIDLGLELLNPLEGEKILEIGYGTGFAQENIIQAVGAGLSAGLDLSIGMGNAAKRNLSRTGLAERMALVQSDTLPIPFPRGSFDGIFSSFTLELFDSPEIPKVLKECRRVLNGAGRLVIVSLSKDDPLPLIGRIYETLHNRYPMLLDCRPIPARELLEKAGFEIQEVIKTSMWGLPVIILDARNI
jgi:demethylmenaquinone methyltransferase/2-methoxy-6-polyprenyl-1,4-benzoquinol methylase